MHIYRLGNFFYNNKIPFFPKLCDFLIRIIHNCAIYSCTDIGKGTVFAYGGIGVIVHKRCKIGKNCMIGSNVTIGGRSKSINVPVIEDNVVISTGAKILGSIHIGEGSVIGANAVVIHDVPAKAVVAGIPAKVIKTNINYQDYL